MCALSLVAVNVARAQPALAARPPVRLPGIRFAVDTAETPAPARGAFHTIVGVVEFAAGRGRLEVTALRGGPTLAVDGVTLAAPLAGPGDYYLFDSTGFVLVRPVARAFSSFQFSRASWRHGDVREADEGMMSFSRLRADTLAPRDSARLTQHGVVTIRWHLDRLQASQSVTILARGWLDIADAPAGEASVARWFGAARALASTPDGVTALPPDSLQVTAAVVVAPPGRGRTPVTLIVLHRLLGAAAMDIGADRLTLPTGYQETPWPGFERAVERFTPSRDAGAKWRSVPAPLSSHDDRL